jgi:hypothetical protein
VTEARGEGEAVTTLVCSCGQRLKTTGARPGRLGRCPACGNQFRVPEDAPLAPAPAAKPPPTTPPVEAVPRGYDLGPAPGSVTTAYVVTGRSNGERGGPSRVIRRGLIRRPKQLEATFWESLLYPFWDDAGLALLVFLPLALWLTSLPVLNLVPTILQGLSRFSIMAPFALPMILVLALVVGYTLLFLGGVVVSSAQGEIHHPRLPDGDLAEAVQGLARWAWAGLVGFAVGGLPALAYWLACGDIDLFDFIILAELVALGTAYSQMALVACLVHESLLAANPIMVSQAIWRVGWSYIRPCLLTGFALTLAVAAFALVAMIPNGFVWAAALWAFWVFVLYEAMVVLRGLGLFYHRHASALGWFHDRPQWGA